jgi:hypothetical protein
LDLMDLFQLKELNEFQMILNGKLKTKLGIKKKVKIILYFWIFFRIFVYI